MQTIDFEEVLQTILAKDSRYAPDAYRFVREALEHTQRTLGPTPKNQVRHVSGQQLLAGAREYALAEYGPMALTVLEEWGLRACEDIGEIVFSMVAASLLAKTDQDSREDFKGVYDFEEAFRRPFLPAGRARPPSPEAKAV